MKNRRNDVRSAPHPQESPDIPLGGDLHLVKKIRRTEKCAGLRSSAGCSFDDFEWEKILKKFPVS